MNNKQLKRLRKKKKLQKRENVMKNNRPKVTDPSCMTNVFTNRNKSGRLIFESKTEVSE